MELDLRQTCHEILEKSSKIVPLGAPVKCSHVAGIMNYRDAAALSALGPWESTLVVQIGISNFSTAARYELGTWGA